MEIQHPARDRAEDNKQKTEASLSEALNTIKDLKEYLLKRQKFEDILVLREVEKSVKKSLKILNSITLKNEEGKQGRIYSNKQIQENLYRVLERMPASELDKFCSKEYSKSVFDLNFALLLKVPDHYSLAEKRDAVKDHSGLNRWTWKYEIHKDEYLYALTTQWYPWNDPYVNQWLRKNRVK